MFLAIINDTFTEVKAEIAAKKLAYDVGDYIKRGYNNVLGKVGQRDKVCFYRVAHMYTNNQTLSEFMLLLSVVTEILRKKITALLEKCPLKLEYH